MLLPEQQGLAGPGNTAPPSVTKWNYTMLLNRGLGFPAYDKNTKKTKIYGTWFKSL